MRWQKAVELGIVLRGQRRVMCKHGHRKEGDNLIVRRDGSRECRECGRIAARKKMRLLREMRRGGRELLRPWKLADKYSQGYLDQARDCGLSLLKTQEQYGIPKNCVWRMRKKLREGP